MKYIKRFLKSILYLILSLIGGVGIALCSILIGILIIPFLIISWFVSLFYANGIEAMTNDINNLIDIIIKYDDIEKIEDKNNENENDD